MGSYFNYSTGSQKMKTSIHILTALLCALLRWEANAQRCGPTDLGFILDSSGSLRTDFDREKKFLKKIAERFAISEKGSHAAVVSFSYEAKLEIKLTDHYDQKSFEQAVDAIPLVGSITRIDLALTAARDQLFAKSNGARDGVSQALVLITDDSQTYNTPGAVNPSAISDKIRDSGVNVVVIGVGSQVNPKELDDLAGGKGKSFRCTTFNELLKTPFIEKASASACPKKPKCTSVADVAFLLDSSGSLRTEYHKEKAFLKRVVATFGLSEDGFRAGVVTFSHGADISIKFDDHYDSDSFNRAVDDIPLVGSITRIDLALQKTEELFTKDNGARVYASEFVVLITDGSQTALPGAADPCALTDQMRREGKTVIVMGIGPETDQKALECMAGGPEHSHKAKSFDELLKGSYVNEVKNELDICENTLLWRIQNYFKPKSAAA